MLLVDQKGILLDRPTVCPRHLKLGPVFFPREKTSERWLWRWLLIFSPAARAEASLLSLVCLVRSPYFMPWMRGISQTFGNFKCKFSKQKILYPQYFVFAYFLNMYTTVWKFLKNGSILYLSLLQRHLCFFPPPRLCFKDRAAARGERCHTNQSPVSSLSSPLFSQTWKQNLAPL